MAECGKMNTALWSITTYYNPLGYSSRLANYRAFRKKLNAPLVVVELSFDGNFQLNSSDADIVVQCSGGSLMWQKERLLNVALAALPESAEFVAWLDCDIIFERGDWRAAAVSALHENKLVQLYSSMIDLERDDLDFSNSTHSEQRIGHGIVSMMETDRQAALWLGHAKGKRPVMRGLAWAARRELLVKHGFYDAAIMGSGDRMMAFAAYGEFTSVADSVQMNENQRKHFLKWALPFHSSVSGQIGHVAGRLAHLWHGRLEDRGWNERHGLFSSFGFNPDEDIRISKGGAWEWAQDRPDRSEFFRKYFKSRAEDGV